MTEEPAAPLTEEERLTLLVVARASLIGYLESGAVPDVPIDRPAFLVERGAFVTLRVRETGELRGCRGESVARRALVDSVASMSVASAVDDPRFEPVTSAEVTSLHIGISALTPLVEIEAEEVEVGRHGLMILHPNSSGLLLPQVATERGWDREKFLEQTCFKARLALDAWRDEDVVLFGFEAEVWEEE